MSELRVSNLHDLSGNPLITRAYLDLENVDNTSDLEKPVSLATQAAIEEIPAIPPGGQADMSLKKASGADYMVYWSYSPKVVPQRGVTLNETPLVLSVGGGTVDASTASNALNLTTDKSFLLITKAIARAANGITKTMELSSTLKNFSVLNLEATRLFGEAGSETWDLSVQWNSSIGSYVLVATGYALQAVTWETMTEIVAAL